MQASPRIARAAILLAVVGWMVAGCARTPIDAERSNFLAPSELAARDAARAKIALSEEQARHELRLSANEAVRPTPSRGPSQEAYLRWLRGEVRSLSGSTQGDDAK